jgi:uncharacterized SAM-binding protein YcdF (DUF218 family)
MSWFVTNLLATLLMPPLSLLLLLGFGVYLLYRGSRFSRPLILASLGLMWMMSTPFFAEGALRLLETGTAALDSGQHSADAVVILGGGTYFMAPEYAGQDTVGTETLPRLRYGARLHRNDGTPILVTGGRPENNELSEAQQMRTSLLQDFHVPVRWTEDASNNTMDNARNSFQILRKEGIRKIYLVTHAWHMPRAAMAFRHAGFDVVAAPVEFTTRYRTDLLAFLPRAEALRDSKIFVHEVIGLLWYGVKSVFTDN